MPSVSTQTHWSWLQDLIDIQNLKLAHQNTSNDHSSTGHFSRDKLEVDDRVAATAVVEKTNLLLPPIAAAKDNVKTRPHVTTPDIQHQPLLPPITSPSSSNHTRNDSDSVTPPLVPLMSPSPTDGKRADALRISGDYTIGDINDVTSDQTSNSSLLSPKKGQDERNDITPLETKPSPYYLFTQLEIICEEEEVEEGTEDDTSSSEDSSSEEEEDEEEQEEDQEDGEGEEEQDQPPVFSGLQSASSLPWPEILRYIRESETLGGQYFSLRNREAVNRRSEEATRTVTRNPHEEVSVSVRESTSTDGVKDGSETETDVHDGFFCHFCGKALPRISLLTNYRDNLENIEEKDIICCSEYKDYLILTAVCMRQMVEKMRSAPPTKIPLWPNSQEAPKKKAEDRALAILRRKQRWEELRRRRATEAAFRSRAKGMKTLKFSLEFPTAQNMEWLVAPGSASNNTPQHRKREKPPKRRRKKKEEKKPEMFLPETLERLKKNALLPVALETQLHSNDAIYMLRLPDRTGFYNYPSGNRAVTIFSLYEGALAYMVYEDSDDFPQLLASVDELGRTCCYFPDGSIKFLSTPHLLVHLDSDGHTKKKLRSSQNTAELGGGGGGGGGNPVLFQPVSLSLNKHITLKCSQESISLILTFPNHHAKFTISSKLRRDEVPLYSSQLQSEMEAMEGFLSHAKSRVSQLFHQLQNSSQLLQLQQRGSRLQGPSPGGSKGGRNTLLPITTSRGAGDSSSRRRTRSTGAINMKKHGII